MKIKLLILTVVALVIFGLDQLTKQIIVDHLLIGDTITVWGNFFDIVHVRNKGAAFGVLSAWNSEYRDVFFYCLSVVALIFLLHFLRDVPRDKMSQAVPISLIFGGALGNIFDRWLRGSVVDFLSFHWYDKRVDWEVLSYSIQFDLIWPAFNVADSAITVGVTWLVLIMLFGQSSPNKLSKG